MFADKEQKLTMHRQYLYNWQKFMINGKLFKFNVFPQYMVNCVVIEGTSVGIVTYFVVTYNHREEVLELKPYTISFLEV